MLTRDVLKRKVDAAYSLFGVHWYELNEDQQEYVEHWLNEDNYWYDSDEQEDFSSWLNFNHIV